ncbi:MAG TPA: CPBP family intramembrane metalloprotease [Polyangiaceae bacterium]|nr:CPBP family intramembrane metalloprotease [Polyangiaceae bacterium]
METDSLEGAPTRGRRVLSLVVVAIAWLVAARALAYFGVLLLPRAVAAQLTLHSYLSLVLVIVTAAGLVSARFFVADARDALGLDLPHRAHVLMGALWGPIVLTLSAYLAFRIALPTLLAEIAAGGKQAAESNTGEFGRALERSHPATTLLWAVALTPLAEELLFRGVLWSAITRITHRTSEGAADPRRADEDARSLPAELLDESLVLRGLRGLWERLRSGGIATLVTAVIFAALHADMPGGAGIVRVVQTACLGLALGTSRHVTGSILPGVALHAAFNLLTIAKLRRWLTSAGWPKPLPVPSIWWQLAAIAALLLAAWIAYRAWRRRRAS